MLSSLRLMWYEEEHTCMSYEEEEDTDTCMSCHRTFNETHLIAAMEGQEAHSLARLHISVKQKDQ